jgi:hypothetical protein
MQFFFSIQIKLKENGKVSFLMKICVFIFYLRNNLKKFASFNLEIGGIFRVFGDYYFYLAGR